MVEHCRGWQPRDQGSLLSSSALITMSPSQIWVFFPMRACVSDSMPRRCKYGPSMPGAIPCAISCCPDSCSERWPGARRGRRLWWVPLRQSEASPAPRWQRLPGTPCRGAEPWRVARHSPGSRVEPPLRVGRCPRDRLDEAEPPAGGPAGGWGDYAPNGFGQDA